jgi:hypothetical protein
VTTVSARVHSSSDRAGVNARQNVVGLTHVTPLEDRATGSSSCRRTIVLALCPPSHGIHGHAHGHGT